MSNQRYTPISRGGWCARYLSKTIPYPRLPNVLAFQHEVFFRGINAVKPDKSEAQANELLLAKQEELKLRAELRRAQEERDVLKKVTRYFAQEPE
ncbi:hypothetical protein KT71_02327 [Congregibacter litoralis KT71]|uniref:Transposase n=1 Tax=Congregibacter litoralis KT71 TaxID=314285 RepID=A4A6X7_9GAMM|nr:hypothetical protein KT71_02327 [Congregibacter litoralis KT71]